MQKLTEERRMIQEAARQFTMERATHRQQAGPGKGPDPAARTVAFGLIHTRMTSADDKAGATVNIEGREIRVGLNPEMLKTHAQRNPLGRGGTPEEAAGGVYLFCSPDSNSATKAVWVAAASSFHPESCWQAGNSGPCSSSPA